MNLFFFSDCVDQFPSIKKTWISPSIITNIAIDIDECTDLNLLKSLVPQIDELNVVALQLNILSTLTIEQYHYLLSLFECSTINYIEIVCHYQELLSDLFLKSLIAKYKRIKKIVVISEFNKSEENVIYLDVPVVFYSAKFEDCCLCGNICSNHFIFNYEFFMEAYSYNTCLNRKMVIDSSGNIKNCPYMKTCYGNIGTSNLKKVAESQVFMRFWGLNKRDIDVCKDCEFKFACQDCRCFRKNSNIFSQPKTCTYNPYIAKWKNEDGYVPVDECGFYDSGGRFIIDDSKIRSLNRLLWE